MIGSSTEPQQQQQEGTAALQKCIHVGSGSGGGGSALSLMGRRCMRGHAAGLHAREFGALHDASSWEHAGSVLWLSMCVIPLHFLDIVRCCVLLAAAFCPCRLSAELCAAQM